MGFRNFFKGGDKSARDPDAFLALAIEVAGELTFVDRVGKHPDEPFALDLDTAKAPNQRVYLDNVWAHAKGQARAEQRALIAEFLQQMHHQEPMPGTWEEARSRVFLALRDPGLVIEMLGQGADFIMEPVLDDLVHLLYVDLGTTISTVTPDQLEAWGVSRAEAWAAARETLAHKAPAVEPEDGRMARIMGGDIDAASYLLAPGWLARAAGGLNVLAWTSDRDWICVLTCSGDPPYGSMAELALEEWQSANRAVSPLLYTLDAAGQVVPVELPPDHADFAKVERGRYHLRAGNYSHQKARLDAQHEADGVDLYVATYMVYEREGQLRSLVTWPPECSGLLPRADFVVFVNGEQEPFEVPFAAVEARVPGFAPVPGLVPARYRVDAWPDPATMAEFERAAR